MTKDMPLDVKQVRQDFPNLDVTVRGKPLVYLDNAATTLKPRPVIEALDNCYRFTTSNVHRGVHYLSERATEAFEQTREKVQSFINAQHTHEIIFTKGATESINLVVSSYGRTFLKEGDEILITEMEHHSNIVPWQMLCEEKGCVLKVIPINEKGELMLEELDTLLSERTKFVSLVMISNSLGTINPVKEVIEQAHQFNVPVLIDAAQAVGVCAMDVQALDCDFCVFSAHKMYGPFGVGVLYGKEKHLTAMPPYQGGGDMIKSVSLDGTIYNELPHKFEAGTPNIADVIAFTQAIEYLEQIGLENIHRYKEILRDYAEEQLTAIGGVTLIGTAEQKTSICSFVMDDIHAHDLGTLVDNEGVAIRTGHHCTQLVMKHFQIPATSRASLTFYNTTEEIDILARALKKARELFR